MKNALVTGAAGGMARGINAKLAAAGHRVICADLVQEAAEAAAERVRAAGGDAIALAVDVSDSESVHRLGAGVRAAVGEVDVLVNAAGVLDRKYLADHDDESFSRAVEINLVGPFRMIREFSPAMVERGWGRVINISSIAGTTGYDYPSYAASKAGLSNLTRSLLVDFWGSGVTVNSICPGVVDTPMVIDEVRAQVRRKVPTERLIEPEEIGTAVVFLAGDEAASVNGIDLKVDGGTTSIFRLFDR